MLWLLLRPGTDIYYEHYDELSPKGMDCFVVKKVEGGRSGSSVVPYSVHMWHLDFNGVTVGRREIIVSIFPFEGEKIISSLKVYPCQYLVEASQASGPFTWRERLIKAGQMFFQLTKKSCMDYSGGCLDRERSSVTIP